MKYIIPVILNHIVGLPTSFLVRVITQISSTDNSFHIVPVYDKTVPGCDKHRINHIYYWRLVVKPDRADNLRIMTDHTDNL